MATFHPLVFVFQLHRSNESTLLPQTNVNKIFKSSSGERLKVVPHSGFKSSSDTRMYERCLKCKRSRTLRTIQENNGLCNGCVGNYEQLLDELDKLECDDKTQQKKQKTK